MGEKRKGYKNCNDFILDTLIMTRYYDMKYKNLINELEEKSRTDTECQNNWKLLVFLI